MKKTILYLLFILCLIFSGCGKDNVENLIEEVATIEETFDAVEKTTEEAEKETLVELAKDLTLEDYLNEYPLLESPVREYGEEAGFIQMEDDMVVHILYPEGEVEALNDAIEGWVAETVAYYEKESIGSSEDGDSAELTVEYDSYVVNGEIVSVKMTGFYDRPYLATLLIL